MPNVVKSLELRKEFLTELLQKNRQCSSEGCIDKIIEGLDEEMVKGRRSKRLPAPENGITISNASRKYGVATSTITQWMNAGYIEVLRKDPNWTYIKESDIKELAGIHHSMGGRGKSVIPRYLKKK